MPLGQGRAYRQGIRQVSKNRGRKHRTLAWHSVRNTGGQWFLVVRGKERTQSKWTWPGDDLGPIGQFGALVRDEGRAPMEVRAKHQEAKKVSCDLVRLDSTNSLLWAPEWCPSQSSQPRLSEKGYTYPFKLLLNHRICINFWKYGKISICSFVKDTKFK